MLVFMTNTMNDIDIKYKNPLDLFLKLYKLSPLLISSLPVSFQPPLFVTKQLI